MKTAVRCAAFLVLLALSAVSARASVLVSDLAQPLSLQGQWQFRLGDDPAWAATELARDAAGEWLSTAVPAEYPVGNPGYSGMLWYRLVLQLDLAQPSVRDNLGALAITLGKVASAYELYINGEKLGGVGALPPQQDPVFDRVETWTIPPAAVAADGKLVLALRVWRDPAMPASWQSGPYDGDFLLGNVGDLRVKMLGEALLPYTVLAVLYLVIGLYHLLIARRNPELREFFWFGLFCIGLAGYTFETSQAKFFIDIPHFWHKKIEYLLLYINPFLFSSALLAVTRTPGNLLTRGFHLVFILYFLLSLLVPGNALMYSLLPSFQYLAAAWGLFLACMMGWRAYQGVRSARVMVVLLLLMLGAIINDVFLETALVGSGNVLYIVFGLLLFVMALMMAERYTEILRRLESTVERRTADLVMANRELTAAVETKGQFLAKMSHEMRTPMNAILGLTHLGLKTELDDQQRDYFSKVEQSAEGLRDIIDSILDFTKLEDGQLQCELQPFRPGELAQSVTRSWQEPAEQAGLELLVELAPDIPEVLVGDARRLKQVLDVLLSNAVKFTDQGQVRLSLDAVAVTGQAVRLRCTVSDTGVGIDESQREHLFEAFSQADNTMTREYGGTGLGLSVAQRLLALMDSSIEVDSTPGEGSRFSFELDLPVSDVELEPEVRAGEIDLQPIRGARILLVDDSDLNLQVAGELLRQAQLYVDLAHDGQEAVDKVNANTYDCVLMDVQMPVMDGYTATEQIRGKPQFSDLPVLAMTANAMPQDRLRGAEAGMNAYIPKPIDPDELYRALLQWIAPGNRDYDEESFAVEQDAEVAGDDLPDALPGINISEGLARVGGNATLYRSLMKDLCRDYADAAQRIEGMLADDDSDGAVQLAHKLRGIARNLGAYALGDCAEAIELPLKSGATLAADALPQLEQAILQTRESQAALLPVASGDGTGGKLDAAQRKEIFSALSQAVAENNPEAAELVEQLIAGMNEGDAGYDELVAVSEALDMYDFATAGGSLERALSLLA